MKNNIPHKIDTKHKYLAIISATTHRTYVNMIFKFSEVRQSTYVACHDLIRRLKLLVKYKFSLDHWIDSVAFS